MHYLLWYSMCLLQVAEQVIEACCLGIVERCVLDARLKEMIEGIAR